MRKYELPEPMEKEQIVCPGKKDFLFVVTLIITVIKMIFN